MAVAKKKFEAVVVIFNQSVGTDGKKHTKYVRMSKADATYLGLTYAEEHAVLQIKAKGKKNYSVEILGATKYKVVASFKPELVQGAKKRKAKKISFSVPAGASVKLIAAFAATFKKRPYRIVTPQGGSYPFSLKAES